MKLDPISLSLIITILDVIDGVSETLDLEVAGLNVERVVLQVHGTGGSNQLTGAVENVTCEWK